MNLYELNAMIANFDFEIDPDTGEITNMADLDQIELERNAKVENIALWTKNLKAEAEALKGERDNFDRRYRAAMKKRDSLLAYLQDALAGEKFNTKKVNITYRKSKSTVIDDITALPDKYTALDIKANKTEIKKAIEAGEIVPGAHVEEKSNMRVE